MLMAILTILGFALGVLVCRLKYKWSEEKGFIKGDPLLQYFIDVIVVVVSCVLAIVITDMYNEAQTKRALKERIHNTYLYSTNSYTGNWLQFDAYDGGEISIDDLYITSLLDTSYIEKSITSEDALNYLNTYTIAQVDHYVNFVNYFNARGGDTTLSAEARRIELGKRDMYYCRLMDSLEILDKEASGEISSEEASNMCAEIINDYSVYRFVLPEE